MQRTRIMAAIAVCGIGLIVVAGGLWMAGGSPIDVHTASGAPSGGPRTSSPPTAVPPLSPTTTTGPTTTTSVAPTTTTTAPPTTTTTAVAPTAQLQAGDRGGEVRALQARLHELGYWLGAVDGVYGPLTEQAVTAFQKVAGLATDGVVGPATATALDRASRPEARSSRGDRVEVDKSRQVLMVVRDGAVRWVFNTSTGTELPYELNGETLLADTPEGHWDVAWVVDDYDVGELGPLYRPRYFHYDGIAVHGYPNVPPYPASHGCVRVTEAAMDFIWSTNLMPIGSDVWVY